MHFVSLVDVVNVVFVARNITLVKRNLDLDNKKKSGYSAEFIDYRILLDPPHRNHIPLIAEGFRDFHIYIYIICMHL